MRMVIKWRTEAEEKKSKPASSLVVTSAHPAAYRKSPIGSSMDFRILKILEILLCRLHATLFILIISATSTQLVQAEPIGK